MPSRFSLIAMACAAPLLLVACEREAQQQAETREAPAPPPAETQTVQAPEPQPAETQAAEPPQAGAPPAAPPASAPAQAGAEPPAQNGTAAPAREGEVVLVPPADQAPAGGERAQGEAAQPGTQAPGEPIPEAAGVASVAAYVGRWAEQLEMCERSYWTFTNLRLQMPEGDACDIVSTGEEEGGVSLEVACTEQDQPLAEPDRGTMSLQFPGLPQTDTMTVSGGPLEGEARSLNRCPLG